MRKRSKVFLLRILKKVTFPIITIVIIGISFVPTVFHLKYYVFAFCLFALPFICTFSYKGAGIFHPGDLPLFAFLLLSGINVFFARDLYVACHAYLTITLPLFCLYYTLATGIIYMKEFTILSKVICISSILVGSYALFECFFSTNPIYEKMLPNEMFNHYIKIFTRPLSTQGNPVVLGTYMLGSLAFHIPMLHVKKKKWWIAGFIGIIVSIVVILETLSRQVFIGLIGMGVVYYILRRKYKLLVSISCVFIALIIICSLLPHPFNRFGVQGLFSNRARGIISDYRLDRCVMTGKMLKDKPFTGIGLNHFRILFDDYYSGKDSRNSFEFMIADNMYLTIAAETGIFGLLGFIALLLSIFFKIQKVFAVFSADRYNRVVFTALVSCLCGILLNMAAYELFYWPNQYVFLCLLIGFVEGLYRHTSKKRLSIQQRSS
ncbi:MAG: O-antigen ligase family protein [Candidatus Omnitrophica bacterium]|nr:O-antigen ligase family protein [Candidatus Omnitrophota bacterium]